MNMEFFQAIGIEYESFRQQSGDYVVPDYLADWIFGLSPKVGGRPWTGCTHMYIPVCANHHYIALEIVLTESKVYVYDPDHSCLTQMQLEQICEPVAVIVPRMARLADICVEDRLAIVRDTTTARQTIS